VKTPLPVAASIAQRPGYGGHAWAFLQYVLGFRELGYEPILIDRLTAEMTTDAVGRPSPAARGAAIAWFEEMVEFAGLGDSHSLLLDDGETIGLSRPDLIRSIKAAPCLIDVMGFLADSELLAASGKLVFLDVDPGFPQLWHELGQADLFSDHHRHVTVGANLGQPGCEVPSCGVEWIGIRPPVDLERWNAMPDCSRAFCSIGSWRGPYDPIEQGGRTLGLRVHEFRRFVGLPGKVDAEFALALDIDPADRRDAELLADNGWRLEDPRALAGSPADYQDFIRSAGAEIAIAKNIYVATNSGWFSDRSACFLASGRPVLCQDTGLAGSLPVDEGLVAFATMEEAVDGAGCILGDWRRHSRAARDVAEAFFDSRKVLDGLLAKLDAR
jgi:hypothetical protein